MITLEKDIEKKLKTLVERHDGLCLKWVCPGWAGVPDRIVLLPGGRVVFVELKRPKGGQFSRLQDWWKHQLIDMGFGHRIIWNQDDLDEFEEFFL